MQRLFRFVAYMVRAFLIFMGFYAYLMNARKAR